MVQRQPWDEDLSWDMENMEMERTGYRTGVGRALGKRVYPGRRGYKHSPPQHRIQKRSLSVVTDCAHIGQEGLNLKS